MRTVWAKTAYALRIQPYDRKVRSVPRDGTVRKSTGAHNMSKNLMEDKGFHLWELTRMKSCQCVHRARPSHEGWTSALLTTSIAIAELMAQTPSARAYSLSMTSYYRTCIPGPRHVFLNDAPGLNWAGCGAHLHVPSPCGKLWLENSTNNCLCTARS